MNLMCHYTSKDKNNAIYNYPFKQSVKYALIQIGRVLLVLTFGKKTYDQYNYFR